MCLIFITCNQVLYRTTMHRRCTQTKRRETSIYLDDDALNEPHFNLSGIFMHTQFLWLLLYFVELEAFHMEFDLGEENRFLLFTSEFRTE